MPRHRSANASSALITAVAARLEARDHLALGARHAFEAAETLEMFRAGVGDETDRGPRELHQRGHFAGVIGADLDDREAMRRRRAGAA